MATTEPAGSATRAIGAITSPDEVSCLRLTEPTASPALADTGCVLLVTPICVPTPAALTPVLGTAAGGPEAPERRPTIACRQTREGRLRPPTSQGEATVAPRRPTSCPFWFTGVVVALEQSRPAVVVREEPFSMGLGS